MNTNENINELKSQVDRLDAAYDAGQPRIADAEYDRLVAQLAAMEPTINVQAEPMLSIPKVHNEAGVTQFLSKAIRKCDPDMLFCVEPKVDGVACSITYCGGALSRAQTMGRSGEPKEITEHLRYVGGVPQRLGVPVNFEVRGELFISKTDFAEVERHLPEGIHNARNTAAGCVTSKTPSLCAERRLRFLAHGCGATGFEVHHQNDWLKKLRSLGFQTAQETAAVNGQNVLDSVRSLIEYRDSLPYEIDGIVVKISEFVLRKLFRPTKRYVGWATAYKFEQIEAEAKIVAIEKSVAPTGTVTPVAILASSTGGPLSLCGTLVGRATLHNLDYVQRHGYAVGDHVIIAKAGNIIPKIVRKVER